MLPYKDIKALEALPRAVAKKEIARALKTAGFRRFLSCPRGSARPVAVLNDELGAAMGTTARVVRLSASTATKQAKRHPDIAPGDYLRLQRMVDDGEAIRTSDRHLTVQLSDGR